MNKGLEIRRKKREKKAKKRMSIKTEQIGECRFISFLNPETGRKDGKTCFFGKKEIKGLQIENKLFYVDCEKIKYLFINKKGGKILKVYTLNEALNSNFISEELVKKYNQFNFTHNGNVDFDPADILCTK